MRDPVSLNKPSTYAMPDAAMIGNMSGWTFTGGWSSAWCSACVAYILMDHTTFGFAARMAGGNLRAAQPGRSAGRPHHCSTLLPGRGGRWSGRHGRGRRRSRPRNASLFAGYGFTGILVAFIARQHPLGVIPAAVLFGGSVPAAACCNGGSTCPTPRCRCSGHHLRRDSRSETLYGRFRIFRPRKSGRQWPMPSATRIVGRAARGPRRRDSCRHAVPLRQPRRMHHRESRAASISGWKARCHGRDERLRHQLSHAARPGSACWRRAWPASCFGALHAVHLQLAAGQRHRRRHRDDAVRHRPRFLSRQAATSSRGAAPAGHCRSAAGATSRRSRRAADQRAVHCRRRPGAGCWLGCCETRAGD